MAWRRDRACGGRSCRPTRFARLASPRKGLSDARGRRPGKGGEMESCSYALRAAEISLLAGVWLIGSGILIGLGPVAWSGGTMKLGVDFPHPAVLLVNVGGGAVAAILSAARAWNHQPPGVSWAVCLVGIAAAIVPVLTQAPVYAQQHNLLAGLALAVASALAAGLHHGPIGEPSRPAWEPPNSDAGKASDGVAPRG